MSIERVPSDLESLRPWVTDDEWVEAATFRSSERRAEWLGWRALIRHARVISGFLQHVLFSLITALLTFGGGSKTPSLTVNRYSMSYQACNIFPPAASRRR